MVNVFTKHNLYRNGLTPIVHRTTPLSKKRIILFIKFFDWERNIQSQALNTIDWKWDTPQVLLACFSLPTSWEAKVFTCIYWGLSGYVPRTACAKYWKYIYSVLKNIYYHCEVDLNFTDETIIYGEVVNVKNKKWDDIQWCCWLNTINICERDSSGVSYPVLCGSFKVGIKRHILSICVNSQKVSFFLKV